MRWSAKPDSTCRVHELLERPLPQASGALFSASAAIVAPFCLRSSRLIVRYDSSRLDGIVDLQRRRVRQDRRHDLGEERIVDVDAALAEHLLEHLDLDRGRRLVAGGVASEDAHRRVQVLVVEQREEADLEAGVGAGHAGGRRRVAVIAHVADADARFDVGRRDAIDDHLRAAVVHEVVDRERPRPAAASSGRRRRHATSDDTTRRPNSTLRELVAMNRAVPALSAGSAFLPTGRCRISRAVGLLDQLGLPSPGSENTGVRAPSCSSTIDSVSSGEPCGSIFSSRSPVWPMSGPGLVKVRRRPLLPTGHEPHAACDQQEHDDDRQDLAHPMILPESACRPPHAHAGARRRRQPGVVLLTPRPGRLQFLVRAPARRYRLGVRTRGSQPRDRGSNPRTGTSHPKPAPAGAMRRKETARSPALLEPRRVFSWLL